VSPRTAHKRISRLLATGALTLASVAGTALAQDEASNVFVDDSTAAQSTLRALPALLRAGNEAEAVRVLQASLDSGAERLVPAEGDEDLFVSVRSAVHERLLADADLLARYRLEHSARAERLLAEGRFAEVEQRYLLTASGYEAALRVARERFGLARFRAAARVLQQLEDHPDRAGDNGAAAELLTLVAAQVDRPSVRARAEAWRAQAGLGPADFDALRVAAPPAVLRQDVSALAGGQRPPFLPAEEPWAQEIDRDLAPAPGEALPEPPPVEARGGAFWLLPTVAGDTILINDGATLSAWDRFSLRLRWRASLLTDRQAISDLADFRRQAQTWRSIESPSMVAVDARTVYASMGLHMANAPDLEAGVLAVDLRSGRQLWQTDARSIDPRYAYANVRGGPVVGEGRVIFGLRENNRSGRQVSTALVGLDARTGEPAWVRTLGSTGTGWSRSTRTVGAAGVLHEGVVYWYEPMGVVGAFDAHDGRPIWLRRFHTGGRVGRGDLSGAWNLRPPIVKDDAVVALVDAVDTIYRLDRRTGRLQGAVPTAAMGDVNYLVGVGDRIAAVGESNVWFFSAGEIAPNARPRGLFEDAAGFDALITGRALATDGRLLVPSGNAAVLLDPATGEVDGDIIPLPRPGSVVPLQDQLIVVDTAVLQSVMSADVAALALTERLRENPNDVASLVSLVLLAERRQVLEAAPDAARRALEALARVDAGEEAIRSAEAEGRRLFEALLSMTRRMVDLGDDARDDALADELAELALRAASGSTARSRALLTIGQLRDRQGRGSLAAEAYLDVLAEQSLRMASIERESAIAGVVATRRLQKLLPLHGYEIIEPHEARARALLEGADAGAAGDVQRLELAVRLPVSITALRAYEQIAELAETRGEATRAARAWRRALDIARLVRTSGGPVSGQEVAQLGANLARVLAEADHIASAGRVVRQLRAVSPIETLDAPALADLRQRFENRDRGARLRARPAGVDQQLDGWSLMKPASTEIDPVTPEHVVLGAGHLVGIWALAPDLGPIDGEPFEADPRGPMELVWTGTHDPATPPTLLRQDRERALFVWQAGDGVELRSVALFDGAAWTSGPLLELFDEADRAPNLAEQGPHVAALMATGQQADPLGWIVASDREHVVVGRRDGLLAVLSAATGEVLYSGRPGIGTAMDIAVEGGRVWVMGSAEAPGAPTAGSLESLALWGLSPTGEIELARVGLEEPPRWIAAVEDGTVVMGTHSSVQRLRVEADDPRGRLAWTNEDTTAFSAALGWVLGDALVVMSSRGDMAVARVEDGRFGDRPLMLSLSDGEIPRIARQSDRLLVLTTGGVTVMDVSGAVVGRDALRSTGGRTDEKLPPALGHDRVLLVPQRSFAVARGQGEYIFSTVDTRSAKVTGTRSVLLPEPPQAVHVVDGYGLISTGRRTIVIRFE
jgi:outer membrane protein assembly factor BamB